jgi:hypothetical protein
MYRSERARQWGRKRLVAATPAENQQAATEAAIREAIAFLQRHRARLSQADRLGLIAIAQSGRGASETV